MKIQATEIKYAFEIEPEEMAMITKVHYLDASSSLTNSLLEVNGVLSVEHDGLVSDTIKVSFETLENLKPYGFDEARAAIEQHIKECESYMIYVSDNSTDAVFDIIHYGDGFVLGSNASYKDRQDLGVSLHFLDGGEQQTKWFSDGAAQQFRELALAGETSKIHKIVAKHIDLDQAPSKRPGF